MWALIFCSFMFTIFALMLLWPALGLFNGHGTLSVSPRHLRPPHTLLAKSPSAKEPTEYWQGDWVCADCGYVYDRDIDGGGKYFEEQGRGFICPQCSAPRRRYAKKVGDKWGVTNDGGDLPIYAFTFLGLLATAWFTFVYVPTL